MIRSIQLASQKNSYSLKTILRSVATSTACRMSSKPRVLVTRGDIPDSAIRLLRES